MCPTTKVVGRFAPGFRSRLLEFLQLRQCGFQFQYAARGFALLQECVARRARAHAIAAQSDEFPACCVHHAGIDPRIELLKFFQLLEQAQVQVAPLSHRFGLVISLLPTVKAVFGRGFFLLSTRLRPFGFLLRRKAPFKRVQNRGNMINELRASDRRRSREFGIPIDRLPPCSKDGLTPLRQKRSNSFSAAEADSKSCTVSPSLGRAD